MFQTFLHSCGSVYEYIEGWIESGIDILNPVQISAANMEPRRLMDEFGGRVVFWGGGCDTRHVLPNGTPQEVVEHVKQQVGILSTGGGFVFQQVHNILANVPPENIVAMFDAVNSVS